MSPYAVTRQILAEARTWAKLAIPHRAGDARAAIAAGRDLAVCTLLVEAGEWRERARTQRRAQ